MKSLGTESQKTSVWAFQSQKKYQNQKTQEKKQQPKHLPIFTKANICSIPKGALSKDDEVRRERLYQPHLSMELNTEFLIFQ